MNKEPQEILNVVFKKLRKAESNSGYDHFVSPNQPHSLSVRSVECMHIKFASLTKSVLTD